jgi:hypothetical protein
MNDDGRSDSQIGWRENRNAVPAHINDGHRNKRRTPEAQCPDNIEAFPPERARPVFRFGILGHLHPPTDTPSLLRTLPFGSLGAKPLFWTQSLLYHLP